MVQGQGMWYCKNHWSGHKEGPPGKKIKKSFDDFIYVIVEIIESLPNILGRQDKIYSFRKELSKWKNKFLF